MKLYCIWYHFNKKNIRNIVKNVIKNESNIKNFYH